MRQLGMVFVLAGAAVAMSCSRGTEPGTTKVGSASTADARPAEAAADAAPIGVDEFMKNVEALRGEVVVEGVVSAVAEKERQVALIDLAEFERCSVVTCAESTLPVRWSGELPTVTERVRVRGKVEEDSGKLIFVAASADKLPPGAPEQ